MAISITTGYTLSANESTPGIKNFWVNTDRIATITPNTGGPITAFTTVSGSGTWVSLECDNGEGDYTSTATAASGGLEYVLAGNYRIGGLSQDKLDQVEDLLQSSRVSIIAERRDGVFEFLTKNGASFTGATITSGVGGGGAATIGSAITFAAQDREKPAVVTVVTTLAGITDA